ncbi:uncharacterized protein MELLADRAFT_111359 [Melampsora larici-populina 98AG31]|uniref:Uncharacterized protein n=1 Tax=Melampsora larici-populina (strain 98AG31 / pathotype 3-4-7) TaxID=747676 RepID=F4S2Y6_MELLP|nr:uncharacterized protein MELLADRAFT_111359 [Melampsora larici-populina 98AG31]EGG00998.1 hypothetical protein MELLADRAFT_111359 [Melampsora larici-populina 98AG31]
MPRPSHHWKRGAAVTSLKALNASVYASLPKSTEVICQSLATFTQGLLGYDKLNKTYPAGPTPDKRCQLRPLTQAQIMADRTVFATNPMTADEGTPEDSLLVFKAFCLTDLKNHEIHRLTFDWAQPDRDTWNRTMAIFIVKHWQYAQLQGSFGNQAITPAHNTEGICIAIRSGKTGDLLKKIFRRRPVGRKECCLNIAWFRYLVFSWRLILAKAPPRYCLIRTVVPTRNGSLKRPTVQQLAWFGGAKNTHKYFIELMSSLSSILHQLRATDLLLKGSTKFEP